MINGTNRWSFISLIPLLKFKKFLEKTVYDIYLEQQVDWNQGTSDYNENSENNIACIFRVWSALVDSP